MATHTRFRDYAHAMFLLKRLHKLINKNKKHKHKQIGPGDKESLFCKKKNKQMFTLLQKTSSYDTSNDVKTLFFDNTNYDSG